ncbi:TPA: hypothetical protein ACLBZ7_005547 [Bacillus cereus]|nr:hypothetical protein [Bacillus cereus]
MLTEKEFKSRIEYYKQDDRFGKIFIPNNIFEVLLKDERLTKRGKRTTTHVDVAYAYIYLYTWLYRNAKYGSMSTENSDVGSLKELIGFSKTEKRINYIIKKDGVLDDLGLTRTIPYKDAPALFQFNDDVIEFYTVSDEKIPITNNRQTVKEPVFALENSDGEYGYGTFFGSMDNDNIANTHNVDFEVFIKCMTNEKLGTDAFYLYSFLKHKCDVSGGSIEIALTTISQQTGITRGKRNDALENLKKYNLIHCTPATYIIDGEPDGASIYKCKGAENYISDGVKFNTRTVAGKKKEEV